ncbi:MAG: glycosyltransferase, partial [Gammaproteobacteria bacterium]
TMQRLGRGYHLHLVGSSMPGKLPGNVSRSSGFLGAAQVAHLLASSDALLHAGDRETFGLVVLEAMASGLPVVGIRAGAIAELVVPGTGLLAPSPSPEVLADTVRALFADGYREMGCIARRHVVANYAWDKVLPRLLEHYRDLCGIPTEQRNVANG